MDVEYRTARNGPDTKPLKQVVHGLDSSAELVEEGFRVVDLIGTSFEPSRSTDFTGRISDIEQPAQVLK